MNRNYSKLPKIVHDWLWLYKAWIVGSAVDWYINESSHLPKDIDIVIPPNHWNDACKLIHRDAVLSVNNFGGFKYSIDNWLIDFWPDHIEDLLEKIKDTTDKPSTRILRLKPYTLININV